MTDANDLPRLYLHIGYHKTGTTSLQSSLGRNRPLLLGKGIFYPENIEMHPNKHSLLAVAARKLTRGGPANPEEVRALCESYATQVAQSACPVAIMSAEGISTSGPQQIDVFAGFQDFFRVTIVAGVRRQDGFLQSWYQQLIKERRFSGSFAEFVREEDWSRIFYHKTLANWASAFGQENLRVISFDRANTQPGRIHRALVDVMTEGRLPDGLPEVAVNRAYPSVFLELLRQMSHEKDLPATPDAYLEALRLVRNRVGKKLTHPVFSKTYLNDAFRHEILDRFEADNAALSETYFDGEPAFPGFDRETLAEAPERAEISFSEMDLSLAALEMLRAQNALIERKPGVSRARALRAEAKGRTVAGPAAKTEDTTAPTTEDPATQTGPGAGRRGLGKRRGRGKGLDADGAPRGKGRNPDGPRQGKRRKPDGTGQGRQADEAGPTNDGKPDDAAARPRRNPDGPRRGKGKGQGKRRGKGMGPGRPSAD